MSAVSKLYELCQQLKLSRPTFKFYNSRCVVTVAEIGKAEGYHYDSKSAKTEAAENLLATEKGQELLQKAATKYAWAKMEQQNKKMLAKMLMTHAQAIGLLLLENENDAELHSRCNDIAKKMAVLLIDFDV